MDLHQVPIAFLSLINGPESQSEGWVWGWRILHFAWRQRKKVSSSFERKIATRALSWTMKPKTHKHSSYRCQVRWYNLLLASSIQYQKYKTKAKSKWSIKIMLEEFHSQVCALLGTSVVLYIATMPRKYDYQMNPSVKLCKKGARRYSPAAMQQASFSEYDF